MELSFYKILAVGAGGFLGASGRFIISTFVESKIPDSGFPWGTFLVNMLGCLLIGCLIGFFDQKNWGDPTVRLFLFTGILGGFTTFSAFANDSLLLFQNQQILSSLLNITGQVFVGLLLVWLGYQSVKWIN